MEGITHRQVIVNGINMHVAEKGEGPVILFIHGFPELWYTWRHQIIFLAAQGYRAVAPDLRGYGDTVSPTSIESYSILQIVGDLIALIGTLGVDKVFVVGHDWGALIAWYLCLFRPDRVKALVNLSVAFIPRYPNSAFVPAFRALYGDDYYIVKIQEPGVVEAEFATVSTETLLTNILAYRKTGPIMLPDGGGLWTKPNPPPLPSWLTEEDIVYNASKFGPKGFTGPLNYYRALDLNWVLTAPWTGAKVIAPCLFIVGDLDVTYTSPGWMEYIKEGNQFKEDVPLLEDIIVMKDVAHFINQEKPNEINKYIYDFFQKF
ncbi:hypothetical protein ACHQM5_026676 [Ranunculus cassubicifolius]